VLAAAAPLRVPFVDSVWRRNNLSDYHRDTNSMLIVLIDKLEEEIDVLNFEVEALKAQMEVVLGDHTMQHAMAVHKMKWAMMLTSREGTA